MEFTVKIGKAVNSKGGKNVEEQNLKSYSLLIILQLWSANTLLYDICQVY